MAEQEEKTTEKKEKTPLTPEEKATNRVKLRDLLIMAAAGLAIVAFGLDIATGVVGVGVYTAGRLTNTI